jgi:hypothetical protein
MQAADFNCFRDLVDTSSIEICIEILKKEENGSYIDYLCCLTHILKKMINSALTLNFCDKVNLVTDEFIYKTSLLFGHYNTDEMLEESIEIYNCENRIEKKCFKLMKKTLNLFLKSPFELDKYNVVSQTYLYIESLLRLREARNAFLKGRFKVNKSNCKGFNLQFSINFNIDKSISDLEMSEQHVKVLYKSIQS